MTRSARDIFTLPWLCLNSRLVCHNRVTSTEVRVTIWAKEKTMCSHFIWTTWWVARVKRIIKTTTRCRKWVHFFFGCYFFNNTKKRTLGLQLATVIFHGISEARPRKTRVSKLRSFLHSEKHEEANRIPQKHSEIIQLQIAVSVRFPIAELSILSSHQQHIDVQLSWVRMGGSVNKFPTDLELFRFDLTSLSSLPLLGRGSWAENFSNLIGILSWGSGGALLVHKQIFCVELTAFLSSNICAEEGKISFSFAMGKE